MLIFGLIYGLKKLQNLSLLKAARLFHKLLNLIIKWLCRKVENIFTFDTMKMLWYILFVYIGLYCMAGSNNIWQLSQIFSTVKIELLANYQDFEESKEDSQKESENATEKESKLFSNKNIDFLNSMAVNSQSKIEYLHYNEGLSNLYVSNLITPPPNMLFA
jgi:hypothetical protein